MSLDFPQTIFTSRSRDFQSTIFFSEEGSAANSFCGLCCFSALRSHRVKGCISKFSVSFSFFCSITHISNFSVETVFLARLSHPLFRVDHSRLGIFQTCQLSNMINIVHFVIVTVQDRPKL